MSERVSYYFRGGGLVLLVADRCLWVPDPTARTPARACLPGSAREMNDLVQIHVKMPQFASCVKGDGFDWGQAVLYRLAYFI